MSTDVEPSSTGADDSTRRTESSGAHVTERQARDVAEAAREQEWTRPSFAKELYLGRFDLSLIHPYPLGTADDERRGDEFLTRLRAYCETLDGGLIEREAMIPDDYVKGFAELGCFGMKIPLEYGGLGLSMAYYGRALMLAGSVHPSIGTLLSAHQSIGVPEPVKMFGTKEQKAAFLPRCAQGAVSAFLLTEFDVGSDPARLATTATPTDDGDAYILDGVKLWTTNGVIAELLVVMATVPKREGSRGGITAFVVEADAPGITVENRNAFMGLRGHRKWRHEIPPGPGAGGEPPRRRGTRPQNCADDPQLGSARDPRDVRRRREVVSQDRSRVGERAGSVGTPDRRPRGCRQQARVHGGDRVRARGRARSVVAAC